MDAKRNRTVSLCLIITNMLQTYNGFMTNSVHVARAHMEVITQLQEGMIFMFEWLPKAFSSNFHLISSLFPIFAVDENPSLVATWRKCSECDTCCVMFPLWRPFSKVCGYRMRFRRIYVWMLSVTATKCLRIQTNPDTCGRGLIMFGHVIVYVVRINFAFVISVQLAVCLCV